MDIGVLGGGIAGLSTAHYLLRAGHHPIVFDTAEGAGRLSHQVHHKGCGEDKKEIHYGYEPVSALAFGKDACYGKGNVGRAEDSRRM